MPIDGYSVLAVTLFDDFALSYNGLTLWRNVIGPISYCSEHIGAVIASYSYRSKLTDQHFLPLLVIAFPYLFMLFNFPISLCTMLE